MRKTVHRLELRNLLARSQDSFFQDTLLDFIKSRSEDEEPPPPPRLKKKEMESETYLLLLEHLNGGKSFSGRFVVPHDASVSSSDVCLSKDTVFLYTVVQAIYPSEVKFSGYGKASLYKRNTFGVVQLPDGSRAPVHILWLFEKRIQFDGPGTAGVSQRFIHIRKLKVVSKEEAMGGEVPFGDLYDKMGTTFAKTNEVGEPLVLLLHKMVSELAVVPLHTRNPRLPLVYGLKFL